MWWRRSPVVKSLAQVSSVLVAVNLLTSCTDVGREPLEAVPDNLEEILASAHRTMTIKTAAENVLIRDCMQSQGFEFFVDSVVDIEEITGRQQLEIFIGQLTVETAPTTGYGPYVDSPYFASADAMEDEVDFESSSQGRNSAYYNDLSAADKDAYEVVFRGDSNGTYIQLDDGTGIPTSGCVGEAGKELLGEKLVDVTLAFNRVQNVVAQLNVADDVTLIETSEEWAACMSDKGYNFSSVGDAIAAGVALRGDAVAAQDDEIAQAIADAECQASVDLAAEVIRAYERKQSELIAGHLDDILAWYALEDVVLAKSSAVLGVTYEPAS
jgi:hypothetical protein